MSSFLRICILCIKLCVQNLAVIFNDLFGGVVYAGLDTDKHKYPIGSGRVTFNNSKSYMKVSYTLNSRHIYQEKYYGGGGGDGRWGKKSKMKSEGEKKKKVGKLHKKRGRRL